jgi:hypothetical protein
MKTLLWLTGVCSILLAASCKLAADSAPPYVITKPISYCTEKPGYYTFAGIEFVFLNASTKTAVEIAASCMVFDPDSHKNPFIGSNMIRAVFKGAVPGGQKKDFIIPLDPYIYSAPDSPYLIDFFYISRIVYEDGSVWEDNNGIYHTGGMVN